MNNINEAIEAALPLVDRIAKKAYKNARLQHGAELDDLIAEGNLALVEAAQTWDPDQGTLDRYASKAIRGAIHNYLATTGAIPVPPHIHETYHKIRKAETELTQQLQRKPTQVELADHCGIDETKLRQTIEAKEMVEDIWYENEDGEMVDGLEEIAVPEQTIPDTHRDELIVTLLAKIDKLPQIQQEIYRQHIGLDGTPRNAHQLAEQYGVTPAEIRKIITYVNTALRHPSEEV